VHPNRAFDLPISIPAARKKRNLQPAATLSPDFPVYRYSHRYSCLRGGRKANHFRQGSSEVVRLHGPTEDMLNDAAEDATLPSALNGGHPSPGDARHFPSMAEVELGTSAGNRSSEGRRTIWRVTSRRRRTSPLNRWTNLSGPLRPGHDRNNPRAVASRHPAQRHSSQDTP
jgi:hypothetical protein